MFKYILLYSCLSSMFLYGQDDNNKISESHNVIQKNTRSHDSIDDLFEDEAVLENLPKPVYYEPSPVTIWFRERGICFLYKYYTFKAWLSKKIWGN